MEEDEGETEIIPVEDYRDAWACRFMAMADEKDFEFVTFLRGRVHNARTVLGKPTIH